MHGVAIFGGSAQAGRFDDFEKMVALFQQTSQRLKYSLVPTVAAVEGLALGLGEDVDDAGPTAVRLGTAQAQHVDVLAAAAAPMVAFPIGEKVADPALGLDGLPVDPALIAGAEALPNVTVHRAPSQERRWRAWHPRPS